MNNAAPNAARYETIGFRTIYRIVFGTNRYPEEFGGNYAAALEAARRYGRSVTHSREPVTRRISDRRLGDGTILHAESIDEAKARFAKAYPGAVVEWIA